MLHSIAGNREQEVILVNSNSSQFTGVSGASEFVEIYDTTWEVLITLAQELGKYFRGKCLTQALRDGLKDG